MPLQTFAQAIEDSQQFAKRNLLLGNGFSIACAADIFTYQSLYGTADFSAIPEAKLAFEALDTQDFESVIHALEHSAKLLPLYAKDYAAAAEKMLEHAAALKDLLISTIAGNHPGLPAEIPDEKFAACRRFLNNFVGLDNDGRIYTLNYDLLLYWTLMHEDEDDTADLLELRKNDGFGNDEDDPDADYVVWQSETGANSQRIFYLHGALHLFDAGTELKKYTWIRKGDPLIVQAREAIEGNAYPLFVSEGRSVDKKEKIRHNAYLHHGFKSFVTVCQTTNQCFFVFGHSFAQNDDHILSRIGRGRCPGAYIALYGDPDSDVNRQIKQRAQQIAGMRLARYPLQLTFFDAASAHVWG
jgi:hypothetical protein